MILVRVPKLHLYQLQSSGCVSLDRVVYARVSAYSLWGCLNVIHFYSGISDVGL